MRCASPYFGSDQLRQSRLTGIQLLEQPERLEISTAIVGVIIAYLTEGMPQQVTIDWELFTEPDPNKYRPRQWTLPGPFLPLSPQRILFSHGPII